MDDETLTGDLEESETLEKDERDTPDYWRRWIKSAEKAAKQHWDDAKAAWSEYENRSTTSAVDGSKGSPRCYPIYWSSCKTLEPAYYSRTPKITTRRRFDIKDDVAMSACQIAERLGQYLIDNCEFDSVMQAAVQDFIHADKSTTQVLYEHDSEDEEERVPLGQMGEEYLDPEGQPYPDEVFQDDQGFFGKRINQIPTKQRVRLTSCSYDEILHTPDAKNESEIRERAYYFVMDRDQAEERFGDEKAKNINWKSKKDSGRKSSRDDSDYDREQSEALGEYIEGWEIWSKPNRRVYWISTQYSGGFLDQRDDPYALREFFPSPPFIMGSKPSKSLYPTPTYTQIAPLLEELHTAAAKVSDLIHAIRRRAIVDPALEELVHALEGLDSGEFIVTKSFASVIEKGGVENLIFYLPVQELVSAITELTTLQEKFKNEFYEWFGVPDILRGATEAVESATAQQLKAESAHDRFKWQKKLVAQLARDSIEMMVDLALGVYDDAVLAECVGVQYMAPEDQQRFPAALAMLRDDRARMIRMEIESDSMSFVDEQLRAQQVNLAVQTMTEGLTQVSQMMQISPEAAAIGLQALLLSLDTMPAGKDFHDELKATVQQLIDKAKNPPEPAPPPPDYEMLKIQVQQQQVQNQAMRDQMAAQVQMREADRKDYELQLKSGNDAAAQQLEQYKAQLETNIQQFMMQLESQRLQIEQFTAQMSARESEMEEIRLAREAEVEQYRAVAEAAKTQGPEQPTPPQIINIQPAAMPPINLQIDAKQGAAPSNKRVDVVRDELGNAVGYQVSEIPAALPVVAPAVLPIG